MPYLALIEAAAAAAQGILSLIDRAKAGDAVTAASVDEITADLKAKLGEAQAAGQAAVQAAVQQP